MGGGGWGAKIIDFYGLAVFIEGLGLIVGGVGGRPGIVKMQKVVLFFVSFLNVTGGE